MSDEATKRKIRRARDRAIKTLSGVDLRRVPSDCFVFCRGSEVRIVRVFIYPPKEKEISDLTLIPRPPAVSVETWTENAKGGFDVRVVK